MTVLMSVLFGLILAAQGGGEAVSQAISLNRAEVAPGDTVKVALELKIGPGWHIGAHEVPETQLATTWDLTPPAELEVLETVFPPGRSMVYVGEQIKAYEISVALGALVRVTPGVKPGKYTL